MATDYKQPRRINAVSVTLVLLLAAGGYWFWKFFPVYFEAWAVDHALKENVTRVYKIMQMGEPDRTTELTKLVETAKTDIKKKAGVKDPNVVVNLNIDGPAATMTADYKVTVTHEWFNKTTRLELHRTAVSDIKRVDWDK